MPIAELRTFGDGETLDVPGRPRVVHCDGHTAGACALWFDSIRTVCTGDSLVTRNVLTGAVGPQIMPRALNVSSSAALASLTQLDDTRAGLVLPGHGEPWRGDISDAVRAARARGVS